jgi:hypothetical protein
VAPARRFDRACFKAEHDEVSEANACGHSIAENQTARIICDPIIRRKVIRRWADVTLPPHNVVAEMD